MERNTKGQFVKGHRGYKAHYGGHQYNLCSLRNK